MDPVPGRDLSGSGEITSPVASPQVPILEVLLASGWLRICSPV